MRLSAPVFFSLGLVIHLCERWWPLRTYKTPKRLPFELLAFGLAATFKAIIERTWDPTIAKIPSLPGFHWISSVSEATRSSLPWPITLGISLVLIDFMLYAGHRLLHTRWLWNTHAAHHSVQHMWWFAGNRASPVHIAVQSLAGGSIALFLPVSGGMTGGLITLIIYVSIQHTNHANLSWRWGPFGWLFVTPAYHLVHHGAARRYNDSNFGFLFTIWDRMFGTYNPPEKIREEFALGLDYEVSPERMFVGLPPKRS